MLKKVKMPPDTKYSWNLSNSPPEQFFRYAHFDITKVMYFFRDPMLHYSRTSEEMDGTLPRISSFENT